MLDQDACRTMCRYNRWMNERVYTLAAELDDAARKQDRGAPFRSIHGLMNHLLLADRAWLARFQGRPVTFRSLDQELYADFAPLRAEREQTDADLAAWVDSVSEAELGADFTFTRMNRPEVFTYPLWFVVQHVFNHQAHHRGQLTALLEQAGLDIGVTDLLVFPDAPRRSSPGS